MGRRKSKKKLTGTCATKQAAERKGSKSGAAKKSLVHEGKGRDASHPLPQIWDALAMAVVVSSSTSPTIVFCRIYKGTERNKQEFPPPLTPCRTISPANRSDAKVLMNESLHPNLEVGPKEREEDVVGK